MKCLSLECNKRATHKGMCLAHYKKQYRILNKDRILSLEKAQRERNAEGLKRNLKKYRTTDKGRYHSAIIEAKRRSLAFNIPLEVFSALLKAPCEYCGRLETQANYGHRLDRIENTEGYVVENVVPCCGSCNRIRGDNLTYIEMLVAMKAVVDFRHGVDTLSKARGITHV